MKHELKILTAYFEAVQSGEKNFEVRDNSDRGFQRGDVVVLKEWIPPSVSFLMKIHGYTGREIERVITYVSNFEQKPNFVVFGMRANDADHKEVGNESVKGGDV